MTVKTIGGSIRLGTAALGVLFFSAGVSGETIRLSVPAGTTNTLASVLSAQASAYVDTDGGESLGANDIEVSGPGVLQFSQALGSWTGNLTVKAGGIVEAIIGEKTVLGNATTGQVYVEAGATLRSNDSAAAGNGKAITRTINIAGTGASGEYGALRIYSCATGETSLRSCVPEKVVLTADATISFYGGNFQFVSESKTFDLQTHTLTMTADGCPNLKSYSRPRFFYSSTYVKNPGNIIHDNVVYELRSVVNFEGSDANVFTLTNGANIQIDGSYAGLTALGVGWTLDVDATAGSVWGTEPVQRGLDDERAIYAGPVILGRSLAYNESNKPYTGTKAGYTNTFGFAKAMSGAGGFAVTSPRDRALNNFRLKAANTFAGGFAATNFTVWLDHPAAVPAAAESGPLVLSACDVRLNYDVSSSAAYALPETTFDKAGSFGATLELASGTMRSLAKTGAGTWNLYAHAEVDTLELAGGTLAFGYLDSTQAGAYVGRGQTISSYWTNPFTDSTTNTQFSADMAVKDFAGTILYTDSTERVIHPIFYTAHGVDTVSNATDCADFNYWNGWADPVTSEWSDKFYARILTGSGYLWNRSGAAKTIRVICTLNAYHSITIGETKDIFSNINRCHPGTVNNNRNSDPASWTYESITPKNPTANFTVTLPPGATRIEVRVFDRFGCGDSKQRLCYGNICTNGLTNWTDDNGLMWTEKTDSTDMNDYHRFADDGRGFTLTVTEDFVPVRGSLTLNTLIGSGGTIDLCDSTLSVASVSGTPVIANGAVTATGTWTLTAAQAMAGGVTGLNFGPGVTLEMSAEEVRKLVRNKSQVTEYVLATGLTAAPTPCAALTANRWYLKLESGTLKLCRNPLGIMLNFR